MAIKYFFFDGNNEENDAFESLLLEALRSQTYIAHI